MSHCLNLFYDEYSTNCRTLKISDASSYDANLPITNVVLKIEIPGLSGCYIPAFAIKRENYYSSKTFGITTDCNLTYLPDGIYKFTLSICPNETLFTTLYVLRDCCTRNKVLKQLSKYLNQDPTDIPFDAYGENNRDQKIQDYKDLLTWLDCAKADVSIHKFTQAQEKLEYVAKKLI